MFIIIPIFDKNLTLFNPLVAVVILNYNGKHFLQKFLPSVIQSNYSNLAIYVADNASSDDSVAFLKFDYPMIQTIVLDKNYGFAGGYNEALKKVSADYYVLLNSDVEVTPNWINPIIELMESNKNIAAAQPKLLAYDNKNYFEYAGAAGGFIDTLGYPFSRGRIFDTVEKDDQQYNSNLKIFWASGAALFIRSAIFHELGGFDESFFAHQEEIDLCWRIQRAGYEVYCCPQSIVYHVGGGTLPKGERKVYLNFRNNLCMLMKNLPAGEKLIKLPLRFLLDWVFAFKSLISGNKKEAMAVLKAHKDVFAMKAADQHLNLSKPALNKLKGVYKGSIIKAYFLNKRTRFSQIVKN